MMFFTYSEEEEKEEIEEQEEEEEVEETGLSCEIRAFRLFIGARYRRIYRRIIEY